LSERLYYVCLVILAQYNDAGSADLDGILLGLLSAIGVFGLRLLQWYLYLGRRLKKNYLSDADTWIFLIDARKIREDGYKLSARIREGSIEADKYYPPLFFYILAVFPEKAVKFMVKYGPVVSDASIAFVLSVMAASATNNLMLAFAGTFVYLSSPMIFQQTFCLCIRPLSILLVSLVYVFSCPFSLPNFVAMTILIAAILLLHKFATQVVFFTALAFLFIGRIDYLFAVASGFAVALLVSKGYYLNVLKAHIGHIRSDYLKRFVHSHGGTAWRRTAALVVYCPWLLFFAISLPVLGTDVLSQSLLCAVVWVIALAFMAALTNFAGFRMIGEGWRYIGYLAFPLAIYAAYSVGYSSFLLWLYVPFVATGLALGYYYVLRLFRRHEKFLISNKDIETFTGLSSVAGSTVAAYPKEFTYPISYFSHKEYAAKLELDFENRAAELADIIVLNKQYTDSSIHENLMQRGYTVKLEKQVWTAYSRRP